MDSCLNLVEVFVVVKSWVQVSLGEFFPSSNSPVVFIFLLKPIFRNLQSSKRIFVLIVFKGVPDEPGQLLAGEDRK